MSAIESSYQLINSFTAYAKQFAKAISEDADQTNSPFSKNEQVNHYLNSNFANLYLNPYSDLNVTTLTAGYVKGNESEKVEEIFESYASMVVPLQLEKQISQAAQLLYISSSIMTGLSILTNQNETITTRLALASLMSGLAVSASLIQRAINPVVNWNTVQNRAKKTLQLCESWQA